MIRHGRLVVMVLIAGVAACRGGGSAAPQEHGGAKAAEAKAPKDQVVLTPEEQATGRVETQPATSAAAPEQLRVSGRIVRADDRTWHVSVRTGGLVATVNVNLGDAVRKGQVLARYRADEVREQRAKYRTAVADLQRKEAAAALARRSLERMQSLLELKAASQVQVEQARQDAVAAETDVANARTEVTRARALLEEDLHVPAEPPAGRADGDQVPIVSPGSGFVLEKDVTPGDAVAPGKDAFVVGDLSQVWMLASVRQEALGDLRVGQPATVTLPGLRGESFVGKVTNLGQELDPTTRALQVRIVLSNRQQRLRPEMLAEAEIPLARTASVISVPSDAVQQVNGQEVVFVRTAPDRFTMRAVRVGPTSGGRTPVLEGLASGEQVVVRGSFTLKSHLLRSSMEGE